MASDSKYESTPSGSESFDSESSLSESSVEVQPKKVKAKGKNATRKQPKKAKNAKVKKDKSRDPRKKSHDPHRKRKQEATTDEDSSSDSGEEADSGEETESSSEDEGAKPKTKGVTLSDLADVVKTCASTGPAPNSRMQSILGMFDKVTRAGETTGAQISEPLATRLGESLRLQPDESYMKELREK